MQSASERILIHYHISCPAGERIETIARQIALEQTVEVPEACLRGTDLNETIVGRVQAIEPLAQPAHRYQVSIAYSPEITAYQIPQFLNLFFGNISLKNYIRIVEVDFPAGFLAKFPGPNFGQQGLRQLLGVYDRPLAATALKPLGSTPAQLADIASAFALGGGDLIKDDHSLADHAFCPFRDRVRLCQAAVDAASQVTGRRTLYFPNLLGSKESLESQIEFAIKQGVAGVLVSPLLIGPDMLRYLAQTYPLLFMAHPAFTGTHFHDRSHGMTPAVLLGTIFRLLGADISVFPNSGGRFGFSAEECRDLQQALARPLGAIASAWPAPAGGMNLAAIPRMARQYGPDAIYIMGGALLEQVENLEAETRKFMAAIRQQFSEQLTAPQMPRVSACEWPKAKSAQQVRDHLAWQPDYQWQGRTRQAYKAEGEFEFRGVQRQELIGQNGEKTAFDLRYFEIEPGGFTSLEKHLHEHVIVALRGQGVLVLGKECRPLAHHDIAYVAPLQVHQIRNDSTEPFGFLCLVDHERDKPQKP